MSAQLTLTTNSAVKTKKIGRTLGKYLKAGDVVALEGPLGSGKTTMVKGIAKGLGVSSEKAVSSPTYVLIHEYKGRGKIYHLDWYRVKAVRGADAELARECFTSGAVTLVEWPERGKKLLPPDALRVGMFHRGPKSRTLSFSFSKNSDPKLRMALKKS